MNTITCINWARSNKNALNQSLDSCKTVVHSVIFECVSVVYGVHGGPVCFKNCFCHSKRIEWQLFMLSTDKKLWKDISMIAMIHEDIARFLNTFFSGICLGKPTYPLSNVFRQTSTNIHLYANLVWVVSILNMWKQFSSW